ncbi:MAG: leucine-rich repeat domain-containing protein, partial [Anaerovorax sp.]|nr:leucine-rich repeat domain-containing protein [Anaerovorax sp.]
MKKMKKHLILLLVVALVFTMLPMSVLAETGEQTAPTEEIQVSAEEPTGEEPEAAPVEADAGKEQPMEVLVTEADEPAAASAEQEEGIAAALDGEIMPMALYSGDCGALGNNVQWNLDTVTGIMNITGTGAMKDWQWFDTVPWDANKNDIKELVVGSGVTSVGGYAFSKCAALQSVVLPAGLLTIGQFAFNQCTSLENINFPNSLTSIKTQAFNSCKIASLDLSGHTSLGNLEAYTFSGCSALTSVKLPDQMTEIGRDAFAACSSLVEVKLSANLQKIGMSAFEGCRSLERVEFPATLTNLELAAFKNSKLKIIVFNGMAAPAVVMGAFGGNPPGGTLYYPTGGTGYDSGTFGELASYNWVFYDETQPNLQVQFPIPRTGDNTAQVTFTSSKSGRLYCFL